jgi:hypothetical protein
LEVLRNRIGELETVESDLLRSEAQVKELERKLRTFQHNEHFLQSQQQKVLKYDELERQLQHLSEENATLKGQQDNADLLRYKVQTLQDRCARYEGLEAKLAQLELENQHLKEAVKEEGSGEMAMMMMVADHWEGGDSGSVISGAKVGGGGGGGRSQAALWYRIAELQQKEVLLTAKQGELISRYIAVFRIVGNFRGVQFSRMASLQYFRGLIFADACDHALYNRIYFAGLISLIAAYPRKPRKLDPMKISRYTVLW